MAGGVGSGGASGPKTGQGPKPSKGDSRQIHLLLRVACNHAESCAARVSSVRDLRRILQSSSLEGPGLAAELQQEFDHLWFTLLQLSVDGEQEVRRASAPALGAAAAAAAGPDTLSRAQAPPRSLIALVDWVMPQVRRGAEEQVWLALMALLEFLTDAPQVGAGPFAAQLMDCCKAVLESGCTPYKSLPTLVDVLLLLANQSPAAFRFRFQDIVDLLLGWALEPDLPDPLRPVLLGSFAHFRAHWQAHTTFSTNILSKVLEDMEVVSSSGAPGGRAQSQHLRALGACLAAVGEASCSLVHVPDLLPRFLSSCRKARVKFLEEGGAWEVEAGRCLLVLARQLGPSFAVHLLEATHFLVDGLEGSRPHLEMLATLQLQIQLLDTQKEHVPAAVVHALIGATSKLALLRTHPSKAVTTAVGRMYQWLLSCTRSATAIEAKSAVLSDLALHLSHLAAIRSTSTSASSFFPPVPCTGAPSGDTQSDPLAMHSMNKDGGLDEAETLQILFFNVVLLRSCAADPPPSLQASTSGSLAIASGNEIAFSSSKSSPHTETEEEAGKMKVKTALGDMDNIEEQTRNAHADSQVTGKLIDGALMPRIHTGFRATEEGFEEVSIQQTFAETLIEVLKPWQPPMTWHPELQLASLDLLRAAMRLWPRTNPQVDALVTGALLHGVSAAARLAGLDWLAESRHVGGTMSSKTFSGSSCLSSSLVAALAACCGDSEAEVRAAAGRVCQQLASSGSLAHRQLAAMAALACHRMQDADPAVAEVFKRDLLPSVAAAGAWCMHAATCASLGRVETDSAPDEAAARIEHSFGLSAVLGWPECAATRRGRRLLRPTHLTSLLHFLSHKPARRPADWKLRTLQQCRPLTQPHDTSSLEGSEGAAIVDDTDMAVASRQDVALWWVVQEAAICCVHTRLRTHFGGPTQTFASIERMVQSLASVLDAENAAHAPACSPAAARALVQFVDALEKQMFNAYEGSCLLDPPPKPSVPFFRTNRRVCEEWLSRLRPAFTRAALVARSLPAVLSFAGARAHELRAVCKAAVAAAAGGAQVPESSTRQRGAPGPPGVDGTFEDVGQTLRTAALAACWMGEPEVVAGMHLWAKRALAPLLQSGCRGRQLGDQLALSDTEATEAALCWGGALEMQAAGRHESALQRYSAILENEVQLLALGMEGVRFVTERLAESYVALSDWCGLEKWLARLQVLRAKYARHDIKGGLNPRAAGDMNRVHALAAFDKEDHCAARELLKRTHQLSGDAESGADYSRAVAESEQLVLEAMLNWGQPAAAHLLQLAWELLERPLQLSGRDGLPCARPLLVHAECIQALRQGGLSAAFQGLLGSGDCPKLDATCTDVAPWLQLLRVWRFLQAHTAPVAHTSVSCNDAIEPMQVLQAGLVRLARKQLNFDLAARLLRLDLHPSTDSASAHVPFELWYQRRKLDFAISPSSAATSILEMSSVVLRPDIRSRAQAALNSARVAVRLLEWLQRDDFPLVEVAKRFGGKGQPTDVTEDVSEPLSRESAARVMRELEQKCVELCAQSAHATAKAWYMYAGWWHKHMVAAEAAAASGHAEYSRHQVARGYAQFLRLVHSGSSSGTMCAALPSHIQTSAASSPRTGARVMEAMLNLLNLLISHGKQVQPTFSSGLADVASAPWGAISPQLFAQLGHPEEEVRSAIAALLKQLATSNPAAVVYPVLVEHTTAQEGGDVAEVGVLGEVVDLLRRQQPQLVADVLLLMVELGRVTVLWEELWLSTLQELQGDVARRWSALKEEECRRRGRDSGPARRGLARERLAAGMAPIAVALERTLRATCSKPSGPSTAHEVAFTTRYNSRLQTALVHFRQAVRTADLADAWRPFKAIATSLMTHLKRSSVRLEDVSPQLSSTTGMHAPMPGLGSTLPPSTSARVGAGTALLSHLPIASTRTAHVPVSLGAVTLQAIHSEVGILPTKTRPKKIGFTGSDGNQYTYLLKGREDLRLDERIMQFLTCVNLMLHGDSQARAHHTRARHYSVTPLHSQGGLIQWVEHTTPLYALYKAWQQRTLAAAGPPVSERVLAAAATRPADLFYKKVIPALKENGLRRVVSRKDWPVEVLRKVLVELMQDTPRHLLRKELWCSSDDPSSWWQKQQQYSRSVAVMSMTGYVLGLGDRHLDNILLDTRSGEVVHIDYNVCFDKGLQLKVPEIVPFRLTQTMQSALGATGVEGVFRSCCEVTLQVLRKHRPMLLSLLEAFVYDPLVEWSAAGGRGVDTSRRDMEMAVGLSLFVSRVQEMRSPLQARLHRLQRALPALDDAAAKASTLHSTRVKSLAAMTECEGDKAQAEAAAARAAVQEAECRLALDTVGKKRQSAAAYFTAVQAGIKEAARECSGWCERHVHTLRSLCAGSGGSRPVLLAELDPGTCDLTQDAASELLALLPELSPPPPDSRPLLATRLAQRAARIQAEGTELLLRRSAAVEAAVGTLNTYSAVVSRVLMGSDYGSTSAHREWALALHLAEAQTSAEGVSASSARVVAERARRRGPPASSNSGPASGSGLEWWRQYWLVRRAWEEGFHERASLQRGISDMQEGGPRWAEVESNVASAMQSLQLALRLDSQVDHRMETERTPRDQCQALEWVAAELLGEWRADVADTCIASQSDAKTVDWCLEEVCCVASQCSTLKRVLGDARVEWPHTAVMGSTMNSTAGPHSGQWIGNAARCARAVAAAMRCFEGQLLPALLATAQAHPSAVKRAAELAQHHQDEVSKLIERAARLKNRRSRHTSHMASYRVQVDELHVRKEKLDVILAKMKEEGGDDADGASASWEEVHEVCSEAEAVDKQLAQLHDQWSSRADVEDEISKEQNTIVTEMAKLAEHVQATLLGGPGAGDTISSITSRLCASLAELFSPLQGPDADLNEPADCNPGQLGSVEDELLVARRVGVVDVHELPREMEPWRFLILTMLHGVHSLLTTCVAVTTQASTHSLGHTGFITMPGSGPCGETEGAGAMPGGQLARAEWTGPHVAYMQAYQQLRARMLQVLDSFLKTRVLVTLHRRMGETAACFAARAAKGDNVQPRELNPLESQGSQEWFGDALPPTPDAHLGAASMKEGPRLMELVSAHCQALWQRERTQATSQEQIQHLVRLESLQHAREWDLLLLEWMYEPDLHAAADALGVELVPLEHRTPIPPGAPALGTSLNPAPRVVRRQLLRSMEDYAASVAAADEALVDWEQRSKGLESEFTAAMAHASRGTPWMAQVEQHLIRRRELLWSGGERASAAAQLCKAVLQFEESRDVGSPHGFCTQENHAAHWDRRYLALLAELEAAMRAADVVEHESSTIQERHRTASGTMLECCTRAHDNAQTADHHRQLLAHTEHALLAAVHQLGSALEEALHALQEDSCLDADVSSMLEEVTAVSERARGGVRDIWQESTSCLAHQQAVRADTRHLQQQLRHLQAAATAQVHNLSGAGGEGSEVNAGSAPEPTPDLWSLLDATHFSGPTAPPILQGLGHLLESLSSVASKANNYATAVQQEQEDEGIVAAFVLGALPELEDDDPQENAENERSSITDASLAQPLLPSTDPALAAPTISMNAEMLEEESQEEDPWGYIPMSVHTGANGEVSVVIDCSLHDPEVPSTPLVTPALHNTKTSEAIDDLGETLESDNLADACGSTTVSSAATREHQTTKRPKQARTYERNEHAEALLARVASKLEGSRKIIPNLDQASTHMQSLSVNEEVEYLLRQATSLDNLCQMFEGWMAWI